MWDPRLTIPDLYEALVEAEELGLMDAITSLEAEISRRVGRSRGPEAARPPEASIRQDANPA
jgi:hypothetical protein